MQRPKIDARSQPNLWVLQILNHFSQIIRGHPRIGVARNVQLIFGNRIQLRQRKDLRIMELRCRLPGRYVLGVNVRKTGPHRPRQFQTGIILMARAKQKLKLRVVLLKEGFEIALQPVFGAMERLQHAHWRQKRRYLGFPALATLAQAKTRCCRQYHRAIDRGGDGAANRDPEQALFQQFHLILTNPEYGKKSENNRLKSIARRILSRCSRRRTASR